MSTEAASLFAQSGPSFGGAVIILGTFVISLLAWGLWAAVCTISFVMLLGPLLATLRTKRPSELFSAVSIAAIALYVCAGCIVISAGLFSYSALTTDRGGLAEIWWPNERDQGYVWARTGCIGAGLIVTSILPLLLAHLAILRAIRRAQAKSIAT